MTPRTRLQPGFQAGRRWPKLPLKPGTLRRQGSSFRPGQSPGRFPAGGTARCLADFFAAPEKDHLPVATGSPYTETLIV